MFRWRWNVNWTIAALRMLTNQQLRRDAIFKTTFPFYLEEVIKIYICYLLHSFYWYLFSLNCIIGLRFPLLHQLNGCIIRKIHWIIVCLQINYVKISPLKSENRLNAFERMNRVLDQAKPKALESICGNCQQLKKENQKTSPGLLCHFCEKFFCFDCIQRCVQCEYDFCSFCSVQLYDDKNTCKCLNC